MNLKRLFNDDDAVSPVIGVILMVAITVILAAVIASFVLGLGDQNNPAPTASFDFDYDSNWGDDTEAVVTVTHQDGDEISASDIFVRGDEIDTTTTFTNPSNGQTWAEADGTQQTGIGGDNITPDPQDYGTSDSAKAGNRLNVVVGDATAAGTGNPDQFVIRIVWEDPDSDQTSTLDTDEGPDA
jgi:flagellin-like protein